MCGKKRGQIYMDNESLRKKTLHKHVSFLFKVDTIINTIF